MIKNIRYLAEAFFLYAFYILCRFMPLDMASACGGKIGRIIGPRLAASRKARHNLRECLPALSKADYNKIIAGMWENLGRVMAEYPHLKTIGRDRVEFVNGDVFAQAREDGKPAIFFGGHLANWEVPAAAALMQYGLALNGIYRAPNNPWADRLLHRARSFGGRLSAIPKSRKGARQILKALQQGHHLGILIDQKYNEGIPVPFFGRPAMTSPAFVELCQKFECPLIPLQVERLEGARFRITLHEPLALFAQNGQTLPTIEIIENAHEYLESWIKKRPEQWIWLHRRWTPEAAQRYEETKQAAG